MLYPLLKMPSGKQGTLGLGSSTVPLFPEAIGECLFLLRRLKLCQQQSVAYTNLLDVHQVERTAATYSDRCLNCHKVASCGMVQTMGQAIAGKCVDCHMPVEPTNAIASKSAGQVIRPRMRNHWIKV